MDAGEYDTNTLLINNISSIAFRIYEPVVSRSSTYTFNASDVENALREDGQLVHLDAARRGYWCFYLVRRDSSATEASDQTRLGPMVEICGYRLGLVEEGSFEPASLLKSRPPGTASIHTPSSSSSSGSAHDASAKNVLPLNTPTNVPGNGLVPETDVKAVATNVAESKGYATVPVKEMHEFFIHAVVLSLSTAFCRSTGSIPLTPRTLLLPAHTLQPANTDIKWFCPPSAVATLRVYLTTTGTLVVSLGVSLLESLLSSADRSSSNLLRSGISVLAAPLGAFASVQGVLDRGYHHEDAISALSPDTQVGRLRLDVTDRFSQLKTYLSKMLQMRGMSPSIIDGGPWLYIQLLRPKSSEQHLDGKRSPAVNSSAVIAWPATLCFRKLDQIHTINQVFGKAPFAITSDAYDPLNDAKSWYESNPDREEHFSKRRKDREAAEDRETAVDVDGHAQTSSGSSPLRIRRTSNVGAAAAAGAMYPTPPDGVQPLGVTPSFDGTTSSPVNHPTNAAITSVMSTEDQLTDGLAEVWDSSDRKREQPNGSFPEAENLFGDLGEDVFENNELTDADFNFFDEEPRDEDLDLSEFHDMNSAMDTSAVLELDTEPSQGGTAPDPNQANTMITSPEFTKPELKHARSTLNEDGIANSERLHGKPSTIGIKRQPSPFNPDAVYKRVRASTRGPSVVTSFVNHPPARRGSVYERMDFDPSLSLANKKYQESGQFDWPLPPAKILNGKLDSDESPTSPVYQFRTQQKPKERPSNLGALIAKITGGLESSSLHHSPVKREDALSDADDLSLVSDQDDSSDAPDEPASPAKSAMLRRRPEDDNMSLVPSLVDQDYDSADSPAYIAAELSRFSNPTSPEPAIVKYFADPEPWPLRIARTDEALITIAQILTEQAVSGSLRLNAVSREEDQQETRRRIVNATRNSVQCLRNILPVSLINAAECQFRPYIEVQDVPLLGQPSRIQTRPIGQELTRPNLFSIPAPHLEFRRYENKLSLLPSAVAFWESLGLGPSPGPKDICATCVFPDLKGLLDSAGQFLDRVKSAYESLKMGTFERMAYGAAPGCTPYPPKTDYTSSTPTGLSGGSAISEEMSQLSQSLAASPQTEANFVVYFVFSPDNPGSIVEACSAFQELFEKYKSTMADRKRPVTNELVLQLVPMDFLGLETSLAVMSPAECIKLCLDTYDRCTVFGGPMPAPAIVLEEQLPRIIEFKLVTSPSANLLHENSWIHIAYAQSVDKRWVTAAWTDNRGSKQMTASYCLGRRGKQLSTALADVVHEIWETTHDLISVWKVHWRVIVSKCGPMHQAEIEYWQTLAQTENKASVTLTLVTVDADPSLQLIPPTVKIPVTTPSAIYTTPVSTPQAISILSPEQSGNAPTPGAMGATTPGGDNSATEPEADTTLIDVADATWGAIVSHRLNNSESLTDLSPALQSGYLVKRGGSKPDDPPVAMEVNIVHSDGTAHPRAYELLLREILSAFSGLATLARLRGVVDRETDVRPWHVAAAEKGVRALYQLM